MKNKKYLSLLLIFSMLITFSGCDKLNIPSTATTTKEDQKTIENPPYYSVTAVYISGEKNPIMELDVKIPKIVYSNEESDNLIDPINDEISNTITSLVETAKANALDTYEMYLDTAKKNIETERENKIIDLKNKYKSIIGSDEVKAMSKILNTQIDNELVPTATDSTIFGFTDSEKFIIDPGLHNKRIIIVEQTNNPDIAQTTIAIEGRPGRDRNVAPSEFGNKFPNRKNFNSTPSTTKDFTGIEEKSNKNFDKDQVKENFKNRSNKFDGKENFFKGQSNNSFKGFPHKNAASFSNAFNNNLITDENAELTLDGFYRELEMIRRMRIPNDRRLTREYIPTYIYCSFDVKCLDEDYLSLYIELDETRVNTSSKRFYYNIDLKNKKLVSIKDVLGENYKDTCINTINKAIDTWSDDKKSDLIQGYDVSNFIDDDTTFFINNNHIPVVVFEKNTIIAGAAGYPEFQIITK